MPVTAQELSTSPKVIGLFQRGVCVSDIARGVGCSRPTIYKVREMIKAVVPDYERRRREHFQRSLVRNPFKLKYPADVVQQEAIRCGVKLEPVSTSHGFKKKTLYASKGPVRLYEAKSTYFHGGSEYSSFCIHQIGLECVVAAILRCVCKGRVRYFIVPVKVLEALPGEILHLYVPWRKRSFPARGSARRIDFTLYEDAWQLLK